MGVSRGLNSPIEHELMGPNFNKLLSKINPQNNINNSLCRKTIHNFKNTRLLILIFIGYKLNILCTTV